MTAVEGRGEGMGCAGRDGWGTGSAVGWLGTSGAVERERGMPQLASEALFGLVRPTRIKMGQRTEAGRALVASGRALKPDVRALGGVINK